MRARTVLGRWHFVDDVALADCALEIEGRDLDDVFETGAAALAELMVDPATVAVTVCRTIRLEAAAIDLLLYDWLSELIFLKDRDCQIFTRCHVRVLGDGPWHLTARLEGGLIEPGRTALGADPKAVTFHHFSLERAGTGWRARVVVDI